MAEFVVRLASCDQAYWYGLMGSAKGVPPVVVILAVASLVLQPDSGVVVPNIASRGVAVLMVKAAVPVQLPLPVSVTVTV